MKYDHEVAGVSLLKDVYAEQFSEDININYKVLCNGDYFDDDLDPHKLAKRLLETANRMHSLSRFLINIGTPRPNIGDLKE